MSPQAEEKINPRAPSLTPAFRYLASTQPETINSLHFQTYLPIFINDRPKKSKIALMK